MWDENCDDTREQAHKHDYSDSFIIPGCVWNGFFLLVYTLTFIKNGWSLQDITLQLGTFLSLPLILGTIVILHGLRSRITLGD